MEKIFNQKAIDSRENPFHQTDKHPTYVPPVANFSGSATAWKHRRFGDSVGRIVAAHPSEAEWYYLRILLSKNVRAIVLRCFPSKEQGRELTSRRDIVIVNEEKKLMLLTLWNQYDDKEGNTLAKMIDSGPTIFAMRLKVTTFNGLSLTTRASSGLMINPPVTQDLQMQEWYNNYKDELQELLLMEAYKNSDLLLPYPNEEEIIPIATAVASFKTSKTAWIKRKTSLPKQPRTYWYTICANCQKTIEADVTWVVTCTSCRLESEVHAMSRLMIIIDDGTASIPVTITMLDVEKFIPFTAVELKEADQNGLDLHDEIVASFDQQPIVAFICAYEMAFRNKTETKLNVVKAYKPADLINVQTIEQPS